MVASELPAWFVYLEDEDRQFIKRLILVSGSLKELARSYGVSYPTIRIRLDRLIARVRALEELQPGDAFQAKVRLLVSSGDLEPGTAQELLRLHAQTASADGRDE